MRDPPPPSSLLSAFLSSSTTFSCLYSRLSGPKKRRSLTESNYDKLSGLSPDEGVSESCLFIPSPRTLRTFIFVILVSLHVVSPAKALLQNGDTNMAGNHELGDELRTPANKYSNGSFTKPTESVDITLTRGEDFVPNVNNDLAKKYFSNWTPNSAESNTGSPPPVNILNNLTIMCTVPNNCSDIVHHNSPGSRNVTRINFNLHEKFFNDVNLIRLTMTGDDAQPTEAYNAPNESIKWTENIKTIRKEQSKLSDITTINKIHPFVDLAKTKMLPKQNKSFAATVKHNKIKIRRIYTKQDILLNKGTNEDESFHLSKMKRNRGPFNGTVTNPAISSVFERLKGQLIIGNNNDALSGTSPSVALTGRDMSTDTKVPQEEDKKTSKRKGQKEAGGGGMRRVSVLGLFELSTRWGARPEGQAELAAARLAVRHVNERRLLPGYYLHLLTNDTKCDPGVGVDRFFHALYTQTSTRMVMLLGSACSEVTESLAKVVPYWNIVQVSFGSTSPALSDRSEFPLFYRTVAPDSSHNPARIAFIRRFGWDTVTALSQNEEVYSLAVNDLVTELEQANITCAATITFAETDFKEQLKLLRELDTRIIIGSFSHEMAPKIFCEAYSLDMFGPDYVWILQGPPAPPWWRDSAACPAHHLAAATDNLILVSSHNSIVGEQMASISGLTNEMFTAEMSSVKAPPSRYAPQTYDAVWAIALALRGAEATWGSGGPDPARRKTLRKLLDLRKPAPENTGPPEKARNLTANKYTTPTKNFKNQTPSTSVFSLGHFDYTRKDMAEEFLQQLGSLNFLGVSGPVSFSGADRVGTSAFYQVQEGEAIPVALFSPGPARLDLACPMCRAVRWAGGQVPVARRLFKRRIETIAPAAFVAVTALAAVGLVLASAFLAFNLHFRKIKSIKLSSPRLNNMTIVGCMFVYSAVALLGLDHATLPPPVHFSVVCTARVYLLSAGFSLAFGSMFAKTYRVHRIFVGSRSGLCKNKLLQDTQLISLICALLLIDGLIVTLWVAIDPMQRHLKNLTIEISAVDRGVVYQPQVEVCRSQHTTGWLGALYVYKGLLLIVGVFMAWETRHVKISALNDSQYIGISVYSVVITSGIVVVLANIISERATLAYVTITTLILISTTATLCLLFIPKLLAILKKEDNTDPIIQSMGLKLECNTRRFLTDDKRELQYRVEIQNKVYRREMAALDKEINRLERLLLDSNPNSNTSSNTSLTQHRKVELTVIQENSGRKPSREEYARTASIGGGLPLLLLSVLPPVIPRASWPSSENTQLPMRRSVTFSSEPKLDENKSQPAIDLYNLRLLNKRHEENTGFLARIRNLFGSRPSSRKTSSASITGNSGAGIAAALKLHMGMIAGLVPGAQKHNLGVSCNTLDVHTSNRNLRRESFAHSGPTINILTDDMYDQENGESSSKTIDETFTHPTSSKYIFQKNNLETEPRVNFQLPPNQRRPSMTHQISQPVLSFKDRAKGSPRFPHKIVPTCSLSTLDDQRKASTTSSSNPLNVANLNPNTRRSSHQPQANRQRSRPSISCVMGGRWKSMEDATLTLPGSRRGSGLLAVSYIPSNVYHSPRQSMTISSPSCDVWATADFGIPLSQLDVEIEGQHAKYVRKDNSETSLS